MFNRIKNEGHVVANHTQNHVKGLHCNKEEYFTSVESCEKLTNTLLFRPPYGQLRKSQYKELLRKNYKIIMWSIISYDYEKITPEQCYSNVTKHLKNGSIVLFHDNIKAEVNVKYALANMLKHYSTKGYKFNSISF